MERVTKGASGRSGWTTCWPRCEEVEEEQKGESRVKKGSEKIRNRRREGMNRVNSDKGKDNMNTGKLVKRKAIERVGIH